MSGTLIGVSGVTFPDSSVQNTQATGFGFKNRIINGAMVISQRGTSFSSAGYTLDRWTQTLQSPSAYTITQSSSAPVGFVNSLLFTNTTGGSIGTNFNYVQQVIEGYNTSDLSWGTANAKTITLSFWVKSSITGTFGGSLRNNNGGGSFSAYPFTYTISATNTWEQKTVTVNGPTSGGTWDTGNTAGINLFFDLGSNSANQGTAGVWGAANYVGSTGTQTSLVTTNGATWAITGVQLEKGSTATSFDYRPYGTELVLCQRYCWVFGYQDNAVFGAGFESGSTGFGTSITPVPMRSAPTISANSAASTFSLNDSGSGGRAGTGLSLTFATTNNVMLGLLASGTTANAACILRTNSASSYIVFNSEL